MKTILVWIRRRPVISFFLICYALSWILWVPLIVSHTMLSEIVAAPGVFAGLALSGIIVARILSRTAERRRPIAFWLAFVIAWMVCIVAFVVNNILSGHTSVIGVVVGGCNEETGRTGLAPPGIPAKNNRLLATSIAGVNWGRFLMTFLFIRSSGGILSALLGQSAVNVTSLSVPVTYASLLVDCAVAKMVVRVGKLWQRLPEPSPAVRRPVNAPC